MLAFALAFIAVSHAQAAAWPQKPAHTEIIISLEPGAAHRAFDAAGAADAGLAKWSQTDAYVYIDRGVTSRLSLTGKVNFKAYDTGDTHFSGLSSVEFGGRYALHDDQDYVLAAGASLEGLGKGRRDDFDTLFGRQGTDAEVRVYFGKNIRLFHQTAFLDLQAARKLRQYNPDQWRVDATLGVKPSAHWMVLAQAFAGRADRQAGYEVEWVNAKLSVARSLGERQQTFVQVGLRRTIAGRNIPQVTALTVSLWRRY
ncbi:MAG: hypothetical protein ACTHLA_00425 [Asticcacaulis sp.]|uniref:hypothetical protein n=1 Tax=Asticcacaulis sp. TaxID=1872648 RepID=UPI003F7C4632